MPTGLRQTYKVSGAQTRVLSQFREGPERRPVLLGNFWEYEDDPF